MRAVPVLLVLGAALAAAGCAPGRPAPVEDRNRPPTAAAKPAPAKPVAPPVAAPDGSYVVKKGDTLYSIALENGADYRDVAQWNKLEDPSKIQIGQMLRVTPPAELKAVEVGKPAGAGRIEARPLGEAPPPAAKPVPAPPVATAKTT